eukprot:COSAG06_NODE_6018_length_3149_cov_13.874692_1_plen_337_part_10
MRESAAQEAKQFVQMMRHQSDQERYKEEQRSGSTRQLGEAELERARWVDAQRSGRRRSRRAETGTATSGGGWGGYGGELEQGDSSDGWVTDEHDSDDPDGGYAQRRASPHRSGQVREGGRQRAADDSQSGRRRPVSVGKRRPEAWEANLGSPPGAGVSARAEETARGGGSRGSIEKAMAALHEELSRLKLLALHARALEDGGELPLRNSCRISTCISHALSCASGSPSHRSRVQFLERFTHEIRCWVGRAVDELAVEEAMEGDAPKSALIELVVSHHAAAAHAHALRSQSRSRRAATANKRTSKKTRAAGDDRGRHGRSRRRAASGRSGSPGAPRAR